MTKEDAIKILNTVLCLGKCDCSKDEIEECLKMAIKALETQPSENEKVIRISKGTLKARTGKYVIYDVEWLKEHFNTTEAKIYGQTSEDCISRKAAIDALKQQAENMLCWSERYAEQRKGILTAINIVSDLLSVTPQSKAEALQEHQHYKDLAESYEKTINKLTKAIAEPQQKTGHWIKHKHNGKPYFKCSECLYFAPIEYSYCPGCGSYNGGIK